MSELPVIKFKETALPATGTVVLYAKAPFALSKTGAALDAATDGQLTRAAKAAEFSGKSGTALDVLAPSGTKLTRVLLVGAGDGKTAIDWQKLGGSAAGALKGKDAVAVVAEAPEGLPAIDADAGAALAGGIVLASYAFDKYKTQTNDNGDDKARKKPRTFTISIAGAAAARKAYSRVEAVNAGIMVARDLVNEPANALGPEDFAHRARSLSDQGAEVVILDEAEMEKRGMRALLGVGRGSERESRLVAIIWNGGKKRQAPVCFVGKGVVFDTGGISLKPAAGMEDMKGDMGGAAAVLGVMTALVGRKAKVNAVGILGLVENMPDGKAQRPGDIVTAADGQTIEIINTDAEGRLVLADALWYAQETFKPDRIIDLATLTGAIIVALGSEHAGMFSNDDTLADQLTAAGLASGDKVWRMPLAKAYDKLIDSKFADMKNTGGRWAGSITAAQFLQRFVREGQAWAHLDIAGTAMGSPKTEISKGWSSGFGVALLDRFVADVYEK